MEYLRGTLVFEDPTQGYAGQQTARQILIILARVQSVRLELEQFDYVYQHSVRLRPFAASMSQSRSFLSLALLSCRTCLGAACPPSFGLPTPPSTAFSAIIRLRRHSSTILPPPADHAQNAIQNMASTTEELVGQSGRHYLIERVLQEKVNPPRRVYLATYMLLKLN